MSFTLNCDWCGEDIVGTGWRELGPRSGYEGQTFHYHNDDCHEQALSVLLAAQEFALNGEGSGMHLALIEQASPRNAEPKEESQAPVGEEFKRRVAAGTPLNGMLRGGARDALRLANIVTLEEVAELTAFDLLAIKGIGPSTIDRLRLEMAVGDLHLEDGPDPQEAGRRLRELREAANMKKPSLVCELYKRGVSPKQFDYLALHMCEAGQRAPTPEQRRVLAEIFEITIEQLVGQEPEAVKDREQQNPSGGE